MRIVLVEPEIPPNTGNIARLCAATDTELHLIEPLGFRLDAAALRRAGMDYWRQVRWQCWPSWRAYAEAVGAACHWFIEQGAPRGYAEAHFAGGDALVFGRETAGLPAALLEANRDRWLSIPMRNPAARSLNLANCAAIVLFEALRQQGFPGTARGPLPHGKMTLKEIVR
ncbi:MAG TPA: tRNA (cytidine(34)-2'-O)-methyltransferase [Verrucomicrobiota bacterium]|nr:tRNA (cytidine(34)-2'-O)-methyltransferase [Verrucomicrobiota bacterium]